MSDTSPTAAPPASPDRVPAAAPGGRKKWIIIAAIALLVLGGGGGTAAWWFMRSAPPAEQPEGEGGDPGETTPAAEAKPVGGGVVPMEQFLVNLADKDGARLIRMKLSLVVETKKEAEEIEKDDVAKTRLRSGILELLTEQTAEKLTTAEGKAELKKAIGERAARVLGPNKVLDVLFTDFVVQF